MNYLSHGRNHLDEPYALVGTAVPDLLSIADRRCRLRQRDLPEHGEGLDPASAQLRDGLLAHFEDDRWFHQTAAFEEVTAEITRWIRDASGSPRIRASVMAHIGMEMLLDAELCRQQPDLLQRYFVALSHVDAGLVSEFVNRWTPRPALRLPWVLRFFRQARFVAGYLDDDGWFLRLSQVAHRARLGPLPEAVRARVPQMRALVQQRAPDLLRPDSVSS